MYRCIYIYIYVCYPSRRTPTLAFQDTRQLQAKYLRFATCLTVITLYICIYIYIYIHTHRHTHIHTVTYIYNLILALMYIYSFI